MKRDPRPALITDAERSQDDQLRSREIRYVLMMSFRALSLTAAAVLVAEHVPLMWLWLPICAFGMVVVPWLAVILANDRPPKPQYRLANRLHRQVPAQPHALPPGEEEAAQPPKVIEHEP